MVKLFTYQYFMSEMIAKQGIFKLVFMKQAVMHRITVSTASTQAICHLLFSSEHFSFQTPTPLLLWIRSSP